MNELISAYMTDLQNTPTAEKYNDLWVRGLITYGEAVQMLTQSEEANRFYYVIQYKGYTAKSYHDFTDTLYTYEEAREELNRLKDSVPDFKFRTRKELKP